MKAEEIDHPTRGHLQGYERGWHVFQVRAVVWEKKSKRQVAGVFNFDIFTLKLDAYLNGLELIFTCMFPASFILGVWEQENQSLKTQNFHTVARMRLSFL